MSDDMVLRAKACEAITAGRIPDRRPDRVLGGRASSSSCAVCGGPLKRGEVILAIEFARDDGARAINHDVHIRCYVALEDEYGRRGAMGAAASTGERSQSTPGAGMARGLWYQSGT